LKYFYCRRGEKGIGRNEFVMLSGGNLLHTWPIEIAKICMREKHNKELVVGRKREAIILVIVGQGENSLIYLIFWFLSP